MKSVTEPREAEFSSVTHKEALTRAIHDKESIGRGKKCNTPYPSNAMSVECGVVMRPGASVGSREIDDNCDYFTSLARATVLNAFELCVSAINYVDMRCADDKCKETCDRTSGAG